MFNHQL